METEIKREVSFKEALETLDNIAKQSMVIKALIEEHEYEDDTALLVIGAIDCGNENKMSALLHGSAKSLVQVIVEAMLQIPVFEQLFEHALLRVKLKNKQSSGADDDSDDDAEDMV
jgi:hypothetical protein